MKPATGIDAAVRDGRLQRRLGFGGLAAAGAAALVLFCFDPARCAVYPVCTFHQLTGLDCPGCGSLRAMHQLLHGHFLSALHFNALAVRRCRFSAGWFSGSSGTG